jgi:FixJ family two-component response regulator
MASRQKILIIDDDAIFRKATATLLDALGFETELYVSAESFLSSRSAADSVACCALVDIQLDGITGFELARRLDEAGSSLPIIFVTGNDSEAYRNAARHAGAAYLTKPFAAKVLRKAIHRALG